MQQVEIRVKGQIDKSWSDWLGALTINYIDNGNTLLSGTICDQSALYGLLNSLSNLGMELVSLGTIPQVEGRCRNLKEKEVTAR